MSQGICELRQRIRDANAQIQGSLGVIEVVGASGVTPFLRALVALNEAACASDQPRLMILADTINKLFSLEVEVGPVAMISVSKGIDRVFRRKED